MDKLPITAWMIAMIPVSLLGLPSKVNWVTTPSKPKSMKSVN